MDPIIWGHDRTERNYEDMSAQWTRNECRGWIKNKYSTRKVSAEKKNNVKNVQWTNSTMQSWTSSFANNALYIHCIIDVWWLALALALVLMLVLALLLLLLLVSLPHQHQSTESAQTVMTKAKMKFTDYEPLSLSMKAHRQWAIEIWWEGHATMK